MNKKLKEKYANLKWILRNLFRWRIFLKGANSHMKITAGVRRLAYMVEIVDFCLTYGHSGRKTSILFTYKSTCH